jgi:ZIP family zinc transporter
MENIYLQASILSILSGFAIFLGAALASSNNIIHKCFEKEMNHTITAIGGGALLAAIALVLIPEGMKNQPLWTAISSFITGGIVVMKLDNYLAKHKTPAAQLVAMLLDFIPETIVIGAIITKSFQKAILLSIIIFIQNLPESFIAYKEINNSNQTINKKKILTFFLIVSISGPIYVCLGATILADNDMLLSMLMTFCSGGILYLIFNDIAPQVKLKNHSWPPMGALLGFLIGMIGFKMIE